MALFLTGGRVTGSLQYALAPVQLGLYCGMPCPALLRNLAPLDPAGNPLPRTVLLRNLAPLDPAGTPLPCTFGLVQRHCGLPRPLFGD